MKMKIVIDYEYNGDEGAMDSDLEWAMKIITRQAIEGCTFGSDSNEEAQYHYHVERT
jgi:hypothetical protein